MPTALIIFIKNPIKGKAKTRLAKSIGEDKALEVYKELLAHTRNVSEKLAATKFLYYSWFIDEHDAWDEAIFQKRVQIEGGLGEKMQAAFEEVFAAGFTKAIIIGSDCKELTTAHLQDAFFKLKSHNFVIGPAKDGGYYLLGLQQLEATIFQNKKWSTPTVFSDTIADIEALGKTYALLPVLSDVDEVEDL